MHKQKNIDSIRRVGSKKKLRKKPKQNLKPREYIPSYPLFPVTSKSRSKKKSTIKQKSLIFASILVTALVSIAGQSLAQRSNVVSDNLSNNRNNWEVVLGAEKEDYSNLISLETPTYLEKYSEDTALTERTEFLKAYLTKRKSPAAPYAESIAEQPNWKLIVGIMRAESQWCKKHVVSTKNCFGVGGAWNLRVYESYPEAFADMNRLLETKYLKYGLNTPEKIVVKYVGHSSPNWVAAVKEELNNLNNIN